MVHPELRRKVLEKTEALIKVLDERQYDSDDPCTVYVIMALVDLIEAICPSPSRLVRDITNLLRSETKASSDALPPIPVTSSSSSPTRASSTSSEDNLSISEDLLDTVEHDGLLADNNGALEMAMQGGQGAESSSDNVPGSDFDAVLQQFQPQHDTTPQVDVSAPADSLDLFKLLNQETGPPPGLDTIDLARPPQDIADSLSSHSLPHLPSPLTGSDWPMDTESRVNIIAQPGPSALETDMNMSDLLSSDTHSNHPLLPLPSPPSDCRGPVNDGYGENVTAQSGPSALEDMDMSVLLPLLDMADMHPLPPLPSPPPGWCWPMDDDSANATAQSGPSALEKDMNMSDPLFFPDTTGTHSTHSLSPLPSPPPGLRWPIEDDDGAQSEPLPSPALSPSGMDMDAVDDFNFGTASDNGESDLDSSAPTAASPVSARSPVTTKQALENMRTALASEDLQGLPIEQIPSTALFKFPWGTVNGAVIQSVFRQFLCPDFTIGDEAMDYLSHKLISSELWIGRWSQRDQLQLSPRCILVVPGAAAEWSLIEAQFQVGTVTHYACSSLGSPSSDGHEHCRYCQEIIDIIGQLSRRNPQGASAWSCQVEAIANQTECDGLLLPWTIWLLAKGKNPRLRIPTDYRLSLVKEFFADLKATYSKDRLLQGNMVTNSHITSAEISLENFWIKLGNDHGYGSKLWDKVQKLASYVVRNRELGQVKASDLLQMALSIASPEQLIMLKRCIHQLRSHIASANNSFEESPRGVFDAIRCHSRNADLSTVGSRVGLWKLHKLKKELKDDLEEEILGVAPLSVSSEYIQAQEEVRGMLKPGNKGGYWSHLVDNTAQGNPNILCLIPRTADIGPFNKKFNATSYRDLPVRECELLKELLDEFRPGMLLSVDDDLPNFLLYLKEPTGYYPVEQFTNQQIKAQKLPSSFFCEALVLKDSY